MNNISANELLTKIKARDRAAFEYLFRIYYSRLRKYAFQITNDINVAEDIVQDLFFYLWTKHEITSNIISLNAYLRTAVYNRAVTHLKEVRKKKDNFFSSNQCSDMEDLHLEILQYREDAINAKELLVAIAKAIDLLPEKCRIVFKLSRDFGMKNAEIADHLGISVKAVEKHITKALIHLRFELRNFMR